MCIPNETQFLEKSYDDYLSLARERLGSTGVFSNQFLEGMKQLYELEPFIKVKSHLTNQWKTVVLESKVLPSASNHQLLSSFIEIEPQQRGVPRGARINCSGF